MNAEIADHDQDGVGVRVYDESDFEHQIALSWDGEVTYHGTDDYPHDPDDRTDEEQTIMAYVEARAKYEAHQEFPDADILDPMWDIDHLEAAMEALAASPLDQFHDDFRDLYEATKRPADFVNESDFDEETLRVYGFYRFRDGEVIDGVPIVLRHYTDDQAFTTGSHPDYPEEETMVMILPSMEYPDDYDYEAEFHELVLNHIMAQIRDLYLHMGEDPPDQYDIEGIGKWDINGDGIGAT